MKIEEITQANLASNIYTNFIKKILHIQLSFNFN